MLPRFIQYMKIENTACAPDLSDLYRPPSCASFFRSCPSCSPLCFPLHDYRLAHGSQEDGDNSGRYPSRCRCLYELQPDVIAAKAKSQIPCRNIPIYGYCKFEGKGCEYNHAPQVRVIGCTRTQLISTVGANARRSAGGTWRCTFKAFYEVSCI